MKNHEFVSCIKDMTSTFLNKTFFKLKNNIVLHQCENSLFNAFHLILTIVLSYGSTRSIFITLFCLFLNFSRKTKFNTREYQKQILCLYWRFILTSIDHLKWYTSTSIKGALNNFHAIALYFFYISFFCLSHWQQLEICYVY